MISFIMDIQKKEDQQLINDSQVIWKHTLDESWVPFCGLTDQSSELNQKQTKNWKPKKQSLDKIFAFQVNMDEHAQYLSKDSKQVFELKQTVYCKSLNKYVRPLKWDPLTEIYTCRVVQGDKKDEDLKIDQQDLTRYIEVKVKIIQTGQI